MLGCLILHFRFFVILLYVSLHGLHKKASLFKVGQNYTVHTLGQNVIFSPKSQIQTKTEKSKQTADF